MTAQDKQKSVPSLSVTEAHPKPKIVTGWYPRRKAEAHPKEEPDCCWCGQEMEKHDMSHTPRAMSEGYPVLRKKEASSEPVKAVLQNTLKEFVSYLDYASSKTTLPEQFEGEVDRLIANGKQLLSSQPNEEQGQPPVDPELAPAVEKLRKWAPLPKSNTEE